MRNFPKSLAQDARGATAVEYGLILSLIVIVVMAGIISLGGTTAGMWANMADKITAVTPVS